MNAGTIASATQIKRCFRSVKLTSCNVRNLAIDKEVNNFISSPGWNVSIPTLSQE
ncbi:MAG: hypothetical protein UZ11_BCD004000096 [Bacteroidetes bacterium OLB11]|nr:MAG: hypothetical protein UZ11_BCD004000096 [Bacteroidetes bacterium OLB11]